MDTVTSLAEVCQYLRSLDLDCSDNASRVRMGGQVLYYVAVRVDYSLLCHEEINDLDTAASNLELENGDIDQLWQEFCESVRRVAALAG